MSEKEKILAEIEQIKMEIEDAIVRTRGREYVWKRQSNGRKRLIRDLNNRLRELEKRYRDE